MKLVIETLYTEFYNHTSKIRYLGYLEGQGKCETLNVEVDGKHTFDLYNTEFGRLMREFDGEYYVRFLHANGDSVPFTYIRSIKPRLITFESLRKNSPENGDFLNCCRSQILRVFNNSKFMGEV